MYPFPPAAVRGNGCLDIAPVRQRGEIDSWDLECHFQTTRGDVVGANLQPDRGTMNPRTACGGGPHQWLGLRGLCCTRGLLARQLLVLKAVFVTAVSDIWGSKPE